MSATVFNMLINGQWVEAQSGKTLSSKNPATGLVWATVPEADAGDVDRAVTNAHETFLSERWQSVSARQRGQLLRKLGQLIEQQATRLAQLESKDNGKLIRETQAQVNYLPAFFDYFAGLADKLSGETIAVDKTDMHAYTLREPLGVVACIIPWNSPLYLTALKLAPALAAGNTVVIKPSEHASATLLELGKLAMEAGFPAGSINIVTGYGVPCGDALTRHPLVRKIAFTGGGASAKHVIANSSENYAQLSLELGGKSPNIIFNDACMESVVNGAVAGIFAAAGQSCVAGSRILVQEAIYDEFMEKFIARTQRIIIGDPSDPKTEMGPMATQQQLEMVEQHVDNALTQGALLRTGGKRPEHITQGWYYTPTIFECHDPASALMQEEIFGPVAAVMSFKTEQQALALANDSQYGLAAGIWTQNVALSQRMIKNIRAGIVWLNTYRAVSPMAPIGGYKHSGYGREGGVEALKAFTQLKTVWVNSSSTPMSDPFIMR